MGCWNGTCGLTGLSIDPGAPVRLYVLRGGWPVAPGGYCYPTDGWVPVGPAVSGCYDDYGGIEDFHDTWWSEAMLAHLNPQIVGNDKDEVSPPLDLPSFLEHLERDRLELRDGTALGMFMAHEFAHKIAISEAPGLGEWEEDTSAEAIAADGELISKFFDSKEWSRSLTDFRKVPKRGRHGFNRFATSLTLAGMSREDFSPFAAALEAASDPKERAARIADLSEFFSFRHAMADLRIGWAPQCGKGSQDQNDRKRKALAEAVVRHVDSRGEEGI